MANGIYKYSKTIEKLRFNFPLSFSLKDVLSSWVWPFLTQPLLTYSSAHLLFKLTGEALKSNRYFFTKWFGASVDVGRDSRFRPWDPPVTTFAVSEETKRHPWCLNREGYDFFLADDRWLRPFASFSFGLAHSFTCFVYIYRKVFVYGTVCFHSMFASVWVQPRV